MVSGPNSWFTQSLKIRHYFVAYLLWSDAFPNMLIVPIVFIHLLTQHVNCPHCVCLDGFDWVVHVVLWWRGWRQMVDLIHCGQTTMMSPKAEYSKCHIIQLVVINRWSTGVTIRCLKTTTQGDPEDETREQWLKRNISRVDLSKSAQLGTTGLTGPEWPDWQ